MKRRWKILLAAGIFLVLLAASLTLTLHVQPANEVEAYKKNLRAQGEKLELSEILPPPAAPEDNNGIRSISRSSPIDFRSVQLSRRDLHRVIKYRKRLLDNTNRELRQR